MLAWMFGLLIVAATIVKIIESAYVLADLIKIARGMVELTTELLRAAATFIFNLLSHGSQKRPG